MNKTLMYKKSSLLMTVLIILLSCNYTKQDHSKSSSLRPQNIDSSIKIIDLDFDFKVAVGQEEDFGTVKTYTFFQLTRKQKIIYADSSKTEYEFSSNFSPIVLKTGENDFELLFEINDRPNKNYLKRLHIKEDKIVGTDKLPTFEGKPTDVNNDGIKEYAGFWDYSQTWGDSNQFTSYNPILYYTITNSGLMLDSSLTRLRNSIIYGEFNGFSFAEGKEKPSKSRKKFEQELKLLNGSK